MTASYHAEGMHRTVQAVCIAPCRVSAPPVTVCVLYPKQFIQFIAQLKPLVGSYGNKETVSSLIPWTDDIKSFGGVSFAHPAETKYLYKIGKIYFLSVSISFLSSAFSAALALSPKRASVNSLETAAFSNFSFPDNVSITKPSS